MVPAESGQGRVGDELVIHLMKTEYFTGNPPYSIAPYSSTARMTGSYVGDREPSCLS